VKTPMQIAAEWYQTEEIARCIREHPDCNTFDPIPTDVRSDVFAEWLTRQYRLAMAKGIQLGRYGEEGE